MILNTYKLPIFPILVICLLLTPIIFTFLTVIPGKTLGIDHNSELINKNSFWNSQDNPHNITGTVYVLNSKLTINSGVMIKFNDSVGSGSITVDTSGRLQVKGTTAEPVIFTSNASSPGVGDWDSIKFGTAAQNADFTIH